VAFLQRIDEINTERKRIQDQGFKMAEQLLKKDENLLVAWSEEFHEGVIGIIAGRLTEKYHKPSIVFKVDTEKGVASASLRGPEYFNVIEMIVAHQDLLERYGGHKGAGGLTVKIEKLELLCKQMQSYCAGKIQPCNLEKTLFIDTKIFPHERKKESFELLEIFAPFGEGNTEPLFLFEEIEVHKIEKV
jgi:single-stranded-DNA-specific exonuclease